MGGIHCASLLSIFILLVSASADDSINITAILDVATPAGKEANMSLHYALQHVNKKAANGTRLNLTIREPRAIVGNVVKKFSGEVAAILVQDPQISKFLASAAEEVHVPILSFSGSHGFRATSESNYLLSTFPSRYDEMKAIAAIAAYLQWKSVNVLYEDDEFWLNGVYQLTEALQEFQEVCGKNRTTVSQIAALSSGSRAEQIREALVELNNKSGIRAFVVHTSVDVALKMFSVAQDLGMMAESYVWVVTDSIASSLDSLSSSSIQTLQGIVGVKSVAMPQFKEIGQRLGLISSDDGINRVAIQAYASLKLVASAIATLRSQGTKIGQIPMNDTDFPGSTKVLRRGQFLRREIVQAISGPVTDDLATREYEIINVFGKSYKTVGFWTKDTGQLQSVRKEKNKVGAIIWPGDTTHVPNGYKKIVIGKMIGKNASDPGEFMSRISGYTSDTFQAAVDTLGYNLPFVYEAFDKGVRPTRA